MVQCRTLVLDGRQFLDCTPHPMIRSLHVGACFAALTAAATAQIQPVASETFEYTAPGPFSGQNGGVGFAQPWFVTGGGADMQLFDMTAAIPFAGSDGVGAFAGQVNPNGAAYRFVDGALHPDISDQLGNIGNDDSTVWVSFSIGRYLGQVGQHWGGLSLFGQGAEVMFLGGPWDTNEWGMQDYGNPGAGTITVAGTDDSIAARQVWRIDFMAGMERLRLWIDPAVPHPSGPADIDVMVGDFTWNELRIASGGNNGDGFYFDNIVIEKGDDGGLVGTSYCGPAVTNSSGGPGEITATGSIAAIDNNLTLHVSSLPQSSFGFYLVSLSQAFTANPGGSMGNLCLGGAIGRYVGPGQIQNSGTTGEFSLALDLTQTPQPTGFVTVQAGQTWNYQCWFRDAVGGVATSNFTDGLEIAYQ